MVAFYAAMCLLTAAILLRGAKPSSVVEWLSFGGIVLLWPAFLFWVALVEAKGR